MALVKSKILLPTYDAPELGYIKETSAEQYVPDVYYKVRKPSSLPRSLMSSLFSFCLQSGKRFLQQWSDENRPSITVRILDHRRSDGFSFSWRPHSFDIQWRLFNSQITVLCRESNANRRITSTRRRRLTSQHTVHSSSLGYERSRIVLTAVLESRWSRCDHLQCQSVQSNGYSRRYPSLAILGFEWYFSIFDGQLYFRLARAWIIHAARCLGSTASIARFSTHEWSE